MPLEAGKKFQSKLNSLKADADWKGMISLLKRYTSKYPQEYYFYQQLAAVYYIESIGKYSLACQYAEQAYQMEPNDNLNIYTYACSLYYVDRLEESFDLFSEIASKDISTIAYGEHGEGLLYAKSLKNDSIYMMGPIRQKQQKFEEAKELFTMHLNNRKRGLYSDFTKKQVMNHLSALSS